MRNRRLAAVLSAALAAPLFAFQPAPKSGLAAREFFKPEVVPSSSVKTLAEIAPALSPAARDAWERFRVRHGVEPMVWYDPRSGLPVNIVAPIPLIPGDGSGNRVTLAALGSRLGRSLAVVNEATVADAVRAFVLDNLDVLAVEPAQLGGALATRVSDELWQVTIQQSVGGFPVRRGRLLATINRGNLVMIGVERWGNAALALKPALGADDAVKALFEHIGGSAAGDKLWKSPVLEIVATAPPEHQQGEAFAGPVGKGYGHRLAWVVGLTRAPDLARWEYVVDAHSGETLLFEDTNSYISKQIMGGIYPITSTEVCPSPDICGSLQSNYPMPYADTGVAAPNNFTNAAGVFNWTSGTATTALNGRYVRINDNCGAISASSATGDIQLGGANGQHDCTTPGTGGAGNTPASRSAFYEVNKIAELARGWLTTNTWLQGQLTANVNINQTCNGFWDGSTINFYRSGGGCRNTGEIAAIFDHEWGHGMDDNDANPVISNPGEGYADIVGIYKLQSSCVGYGFFQTIDDGCGQTPDGTGFNVNESQTGTHCATRCSGVRDSDYLLHADGLPDTPLGFVCTHCVASSAVCGRQVHCAAAPVRQAAWDFAKRDLQAAPFNYDQNRAYIVANKAFYLGSANVGDWYSCTCGSASAGCAAANGYMQWLAADDDDGNVNNGTPHMTALHAAFNRHGIACATPTPTNSGCAGAPTAAPTLTASVGSNAIVLNWTAVAGATEYWVFRGEGNGGCDSGKVRIATVNSPTLTYTDTTVVNDRTYYYSVVGATSNSACFGPSSACVSITPRPCAGVITLNKPLYACTDGMTLGLVDGDLLGTGTRVVTVRSTSEASPENVTLTETPPNSGVFSGTFATGGGPVANGDGKVTVVHGDTLTARYVDASYCGTPNVIVETTATTDCQGPVITNVAAGPVSDDGATITWTTSENANSRVTHGIATPPATNTDDLANYSTAHTQPISGLTGCTPYYFSVTSADGAGNSTTHNNGGAYHTFTTGGRNYLLGPDGGENPPPASPFTPTGTAGTIWHRSACKFSAGAQAWKAGASASCPGAYGDNASADLTSGDVVLGAAGHGYRLRFREWYSTESGFDYAAVQISTTGGASWTDLIPTRSGSSAGWQLRDLDLATYSGTVRFRFHFTTDGSVTAEGWYLDEISVSKVQPCGAEVRLFSSAKTDACAAGGAANNNGATEPGETGAFTITARNNGSTGATGITATLASTTPGVTVTSGPIAYPNLAAGASAAGAAPFNFVVAPSVACGTTANFTVSFNSAQGSWNDTLSALVGAPGGSTATLPSTDVPKAIADNTTVNSALAVATPQPITDVNVQFTLTHTFDGDLDIFLVHPDGTLVELTTDNGGAGDNFTGTLFDDEAATAITAGTPPYSGSFRPEGLLSTLDGKPANGNWQLRITDDAGGDIGSLTAWSLILTTSGTPTCATCSCAAAPTMSVLNHAKLGGDLRQTWPAAGGAATYSVYRGTGTSPSGFSWLANTAGTLWTDAGQLAQPGSRFYSVTALNGCGNESPK